MSQSDTEQSSSHEPVLRQEVVQWLIPQNPQGDRFRVRTIVDATLGLGGHTQALLAAAPQVRVIGIDQDPEALRVARERLAPFKDRVSFAHANFQDLAAVLRELKVDRVQGIVADLGVSSLQFDTGERGFSFSVEAPLDMRMNQGDGETAAELIERLSEKDLADLIFEYGEERGARRIARALVKARERGPVTTTKELADITIRALRVPGRWRIHPATRTFQAFRIAVNDELKVLEAFIPEAITALAKGGRLAIISFHSLEDRIVKRRFQRESGRCECTGRDRMNFPVFPTPRATSWEAGPIKEAQEADEATGAINPKAEPEADDAVSELTVCQRCGARLRINPLTRKPIRPSDEETARNPRSRSALLRVCERI